MSLAYETRDKLNKAILTDKRLVLKGVDGKIKKFAEMRTKTATEINAYIAEVEAMNKPIISTAPKATSSWTEILSKFRKPLQ